jgi:hypothetical protein
MRSRFQRGELLPVTLRSNADAAPSIQSPTKPRKRRLEQVADSEEEWDEELESLDGYDWSDTEVQHESAERNETDSKKQRLDTAPGCD